MRKLSPAIFAALCILLVATPATSQDRGVPSRNGLVVTTSAPASDAGASVLAAGGNAVDAAVATAFALAVTHPTAGNIGGGGFMIVRRPNGSVAAFDYREKAPSKATRDMYLDASGKINRSLTESGYLAPGVPGTVRGLAMVHRKFGRLPWKTVVSPAVDLAENGFVVSESLARSLNAELNGPMKHFPESVEAYGKPGGEPWRAGDPLVLRDLGKTLRAIATGGPDVFYKGWVADLVAAQMKAHGGLISKEDLANYRPRQRTPLRGRFRGYEVISMPPPSSGGTALIEMLNILQNFDLRAQGPNAPETYHLIIEAMRRGFLDRARYLGDPDFVQIPVKRLTSVAYAKRLASTINPRQTSLSREIGQDIFTGAATSPESRETTHFSVLDRDGMAVASTYTLEGGYGSHVVVKGAGFILNNEMGDFNKKVGETNDIGDIGTPPNLIAPGKRMLSSMTPTIVCRDGKLVLITGSPGDRTIINTVLRIVLGVTEFGMTGRDAVDAGRLHHQWMPDSVTFEGGSISPEVAEALTKMGHRISTRGRQGDGQTIWVDPQDGMPYGVNDRRSADSKASVPRP
jgi:gamma-glutamyltranspeptidase / glutathione hydrolase